MAPVRHQGQGGQAKDVQLFILSNMSGKLKTAVHGKLENCKTRCLLTPDQSIY